MNSPIVVICFIFATFSVCASWLEKSDFSWRIKKPKFVETNKCGNFDYLKNEIEQIKAQMSRLQTEMRQCNKTGHCYLLTFLKV